MGTRIPNHSSKFMDGTSPSHQFLFVLQYSVQFYPQKLVGTPGASLPNSLSKCKAFVAFCSTEDEPVAWSTRRHLT